MDIKVGELRTQNFRDQSFKGFNANIVINAAVGSVGDLSKANIDLTKMNCKAVLTRDGREIRLFNLNMRELLSSSEYFNKRFNDFIVTAGVPFILTDAAATSITIPLKFWNFQTNLKNSDCLELEIELKAGFFVDVAATVVNNTTSYVRIDTCKSVGVEFSTPYIEVYNIEAAASEFKKSLGDNVTQILFYSTAAVAVPAPAATPIDNVKIDADKIRINDKWVDLVNKQYDVQDAGSASILRGQFYMLYWGVTIQQVELFMNLVSANIPASTFKVLVTRLVSDPKQAIRAGATTGLHNLENAVALGVRLSPSQKAEMDRLQGLKRASTQI